ncbi:jg24912, partial [Pararge aegeria aegeria]
MCQGEDPKDVSTALGFQCPAASFRSRSAEPYWYSGLELYACTYVY